MAAKERSDLADRRPKRTIAFAQFGSSDSHSKLPDSVDDAQALEPLHPFFGSVLERVEGLGSEAQVFDGDAADLECEAPEPAEAARW